jgi:rhamnose transport system ATP-binding protein
LTVARRRFDRTASVSLLQLTSISKTFAGVHALKRVSFELRRGEVHALVGENGAGKSTLIKIVTGAERPDAGTLTIAGSEIRHMEPARSRALGLAAIYQQPALFPDLTVAENIALALEPPTLWRRVRWHERDARARTLLARLGTSLDPARLVDTLSMPEQQLVEIAKALGGDARMLILDEPTASLTEQETEQLFAVLARLREDGVGIIYISHRLDEVFAIADRVTVLRDGHSLGTYDAPTLDRDGLIRLMVGRELSSIFPKRPLPLGDTVFEVSNLTSRAAGIRGVSFAVRGGEILGLAGLVGSGRTELAETIFGLTPAEEGEIRLRGSAVTIRSPRDAIASGIAYLPEDRLRHGIVLAMPIAANTTLANLTAISRRGLLDEDAERATAQYFVDRLSIRASSILAEAGSLSGGNQQKVAVARWLATDPRVLILDEPTQGVDVGAKFEIHSLMQDLAEQGVAVVMISSELPEVLGMSDRIAVMRGGSIAGVLSREEATQQAVLSLALGDAA